jgi:hypothetical protein
MSPPELEPEVLLATCFMLVSVLAFSLALNMGATCYSETFIEFQWTAWYYIPEDITLQQL